MLTLNSEVFDGTPVDSFRPVSWFMKYCGVSRCHFTKHKLALQRAGVRVMHPANSRKLYHVADTLSYFGIPNVDLQGGAQ